MPKLLEPWVNKCSRIHECRYAVRDTILDNGRRYLMCGYILIKHEPRGCPADQCDKFEQKTFARKHGITLTYWRGG